MGEGIGEGEREDPGDGEYEDERETDGDPESAIDAGIEPARMLDAAFRISGERDMCGCVAVPGAPCGTDDEGESGWTIRATTSLRREVRWFR